MLAPSRSAAITTPPTAGIATNVPLSGSPTRTSSPSSTRLSGRSATV